MYFSNEKSRCSFQLSNNVLHSYGKGKTKLVLMYFDSLYL